MAPAGKASLVLAGKAIYQTVREMGAQGAPEGPMYLACQEFGLTLEDWQTLTQVLFDAKLVRRESHCLFAVKV